MENLCPKESVKDQFPNDCNKANQMYFESEELFLSWLSNEMNYISWRFNGRKRRTQDDPAVILTRGKRLRKIEWTDKYICPFAGLQRKYTPRPDKKHRVTKTPSKRRNCKASISAKKYFNETGIYVSYNECHANHSIDPIQLIKDQRISSNLRDLLKTRIASGDNWESFKFRLRQKFQEEVRPDSQDKTQIETVSLAHALRVNPKDFRNYRQNYLKTLAELDSECWNSLVRYSELVQQEGGISIIKSLVDITGKEAGKDFLFGFSTQWQLSILRENSSVLCLDSTHKTCLTLDKNERGAFLHSIVVKNDTAGLGVPVAFMLTSLETMVPLEIWLSWLKINVPLQESSTFMIDCSKTEIAAIRTAFSTPKIRYCYWHLSRALHTQANKKLGAAADKKTVLSEFRSLAHTKTISEFQEKWQEYQLRYQHHIDWLSYLTTQWINDADMWWEGNREGSLDIRTNNLVESWHNVLKSRYLRGTRKQRPDRLIYTLLREALVDLRITVLKIQWGFLDRRMSQAEQKQLNECNKFTPEEAIGFITRLPLPADESENEMEYAAVASVLSLSGAKSEYIVSQDANGALCSCSCPYMTTNSSVCKHMHLVAQNLGYSINFETKINRGPSNIEPVAKMPVAEADDLQNIIEYSRNIRDLLSKILSDHEKFAELDDLERSTLHSYVSDLLAVHNSYKNSQTPWSQRQRR